MYQNVLNVIAMKLSNNICLLVCIYSLNDLYILSKIFLNILELQKLLTALNKTTLQCEENLSSNELTDVSEILRSAIDNKITELTADTYSSIELEWNNRFETGIEEIGSIKLNF